MYAGERLAEKLRTAPGTQVYRIIRTRFMDENPYAYEESYIPCKLAEGLTGEMVQQNGLYRSLNLIGTYLDNANESFRAVNLRAEVAEILRTEPGRAAISLTRAAFSGKRLVEFCNSIVRGDFFHYTVELI